MSTMLQLEVEYNRKDQESQLLFPPLVEFSEVEVLWADAVPF
jgi:hypothetical protein